MSLDCLAEKLRIFSQPVPIKPFVVGGPARISTFTPSRERRGPSGVSFFLDEMVGSRHVQVTCDLTYLVRGKTLVWHMRTPLFRLPVRLVFRLQDDEVGVQIEQSIQAGYSGFARFLDPVFRLFFPESFAAAKDEHVRTEFPRLKDFLCRDGR